jgi:hypothetical protein
MKLAEKRERDENPNPAKIFFEKTVPYLNEISVHPDTQHFLAVFYNQQHTVFFYFSCQHTSSTMAFLLRCAAYSS